jgi:hypothetical protein
VELSTNGKITKPGERIWMSCDGQAGFASIDFTKEGFWACSIRNSTPVSPYSAYLGLVRTHSGSLYSVNNGNNSLNSVSAAGWNTCPNGSVLIGTLMGANGFWLCAAPERKDQVFYVGNVVSNSGKIYRVQKGTVQYVSDAGWNSCLSSRLLGTYFNVNGAWVCGE